MPYLGSQTKRIAIEDAVRDLRPAAMSAAELNFTICTMLNEFVAGEGRELAYDRLNAATGAVTLAHAEWVRNVVTPYECVKAYDNGDIAWPR